MSWHSPLVTLLLSDYPLVRHEETDKFIVSRKEGKRHVWRDPAQAKITNTRVAEMKLVRPDD